MWILQSIMNKIQCIEYDADNKMYIIYITKHSVFDIYICQFGNWKIFAVYFSRIISCADKNKIPAGGALAVDREQFSQSVHKSILENPLINIIHEEYKNLPDFSNKAIIATGPLTSKSLTQNIIKSTGNENLAFFKCLEHFLYKFCTGGFIDDLRNDLKWAIIVLICLVHVIWTER